MCIKADVQGCQVKPFALTGQRGTVNFVASSGEKIVNFAESPSAARSSLRTRLGAPVARKSPFQSEQKDPEIRF